MELHRQTCQACGSIDVRVILRHGEGHPTTAYVRCASCGELVARYGLRSYYHHGKGFESWLRRFRGLARESGRNLMAEFERVKQQAVEEYKDVLEELERQGKNV